MDPRRPLRVASGLLVLLVAASACKRDRDASAVAETPMRTSPLRAVSSEQKEVLDQLDFSAALVRGTTIAGVLDPVLGSAAAGATEDQMARAIYLVARVHPRKELDKTIVEMVVEFEEPAGLAGRKVELGSGVRDVGGAMYVVRQVVGPGEQMGSGKGIQDGRAPLVASVPRFKVVRLAVK